MKISSLLNLMTICEVTVRQDINKAYRNSDMYFACFKDSP